MTLITPLGLIALISLLVLLLIYLIKPNYQQKRISSTYIWKLSLQYKKKKIPISKLKNLLIIICQLLILTSCAVILAQPNKVLKAESELPQTVVIIDSSASMRTTTDGVSRFERAVRRALDDFDDLPANGLMSVIIADSNPYFYQENVGPEHRAVFTQQMEKLLEDDTACSYGSSDIDAAMFLCQNILEDNASAKINLYTDVDYAYVPDDINVVRIWGSQEWNAAILNARAVFEEGYYTFYVDVACYGRDYPLALSLEVQNPNTQDKNDKSPSIKFETTVECANDVTKTVIFKYFKDNESYEAYAERFIDTDTVCIGLFGLDAITSYQSAYISISESDSFSEDNTFSIYGGHREKLMVQYCSAYPNDFFGGILFVLQNLYANRWEFVFHEVRDITVAATTGYDFYIFEHLMPEFLPTDGVVLLANIMNDPPKDSGISTSGNVFFPRQVPFMQESTHPILSTVTASNITVSAYTRITDYDSDYQVLMSISDTQQDPVLLVKDTDTEKIIVMPFTVHYSNFSVTAEFPRIMYNLFEYFLPSTVIGTAFEVNDTISLRSRGLELEVKGHGINQTFTSFPARLSVTTPGTYRLEQTTIFNKTIIEDIYVKIPALESNIHKSETTFERPPRAKVESDIFEDLILFIAATLVAVLFLEWLLHSREEV